MNKIAKYVTSILALTIVAYAGWILVKTVFPIEEWFHQNPSWGTICSILVVVGIIGILSAILTQKTR